MMAEVASELHFSTSTLYFNCCFVSLTGSLLWYIFLYTRPTFPQPLLSLTVSFPAYKKKASGFTQRHSSHLLSIILALALLNIFFRVPIQPLV